MPLDVVKASIEQMIVAVTLAKGFEQETAHVKVDVPYCIKTYTSFIEAGIGGVLALLHDGKVIGGLGYVVADDLHCPRSLAIETFWFVPPENRGGGMLLLQAFEDVARDLHCDGVAMIHLTDSHPDALEKVYARRGYNLVEKHYVKELLP